jgi:hypothetical protein
MDAIAGNSSEAMVPHCDKKSSSNDLHRVLNLGGRLSQKTFNSEDWDAGACGAPFKPR